LASKWLAKLKVKKVSFDGEKGKRRREGEGRGGQGNASNFQRLPDISCNKDVIDFPASSVTRAGERK